MYTVYNPLNKPLEDLPKIFCFNNTMPPARWFECLAIAEDGTLLASHLCSHPDFLYQDLGVYEDTSPSKHKESYQVHYPDGYKMIPTSFSDPELNAVMEKQ